jgi:hypothetical protein
VPDDKDDGVVDLVEVHKSQFEVEVTGDPIMVKQAVWRDEDVLHVDRLVHLPRPIDYITINLVADGSEPEEEDD